jgi:hypothetical protein
MIAQPTPRYSCGTLRERAPLPRGNFSENSSSWEEYPQGEVAQANAPEKVVFFALPSTLSGLRQCELTANNKRQAG